MENPAWPLCLAPEFHCRQTVPRYCAGSPAKIVTAFARRTATATTHSGNVRRPLPTLDSQLRGKIALLYTNRPELAAKFGTKLATLMYK